MADYDLGTAHGKISIESDSRGTNEAIRQLAELKAAAAGLDKSFGDTKSSLERFSSNLGAIASSSDDSSRRMSGLGSSIKNVGASAVSSASQLLGFDKSLEQMAQSAIRASRQLSDLRGDVEKFTTVKGALGGLADSILGVDDQLKKAPIWQRNIVQAAASLTALATTGSAIQKTAKSILGFAASTAAFSTVAPKLQEVGRGLRLVAGTAALIFPTIDKAGQSLGKFSEKAAEAFKQTEKFAAGVFQAVQGAGRLITGGLLIERALTGIGTAAKFAVIGLSAIAAGTAAIQVVGTVALGAVNAIKQMSGAFLLLPGAIFAAGITAGVAKLAFGGLGDALKAGALSGDEFTKKIKDMSPQMQSIAKASQGMIDQFKQIKNVAQGTALSGFGQDMKDIGSIYLPLLTKAAAEVGTGLARIRDGFKDFLTSPATIRDLNTAFGNTHQILDNLSRAVDPFMSALRDIGTVGLDALTGLSNGAGDAAVRFANFIAQARQSGELADFIQRGIKGFQDFGSVIANTGRGLKTFFEAFGVSGDSALTKMRRGAQEFSDTMKKSASGGNLNQLADSMKRIADVSFKALTVGFEEVMSISRALAPFVNELQQAFGAGLVTAFQSVGAAARVFATALSSIPGLGGFLGTILAIGAALKGFALLFSPIVKGIQLMVGSFQLIRGAIGSITAINVALSAMEARGGAVGAAMGKMQGAISAVAASAGVLTAVLAGVAIAWVGIDSANANVEASLKRVQDREDQVKQETQDLIAALTDSGGRLNKTVFSAVSDDVQNMVRDMKAAGDQIPSSFQGGMTALKQLVTDPESVFKALWDGIGGDSKKANQDLQGTALGMQLSLKQTGEQAQRAAEQIRETGFSSQDLARMTVSSGADLQKLVDALSKTKGGGAEASAALEALREKTLPVIESMQRLGPDAISLSEAMKVLGDASSSASDKMSALRSALQALGIIKGTAQEAMLDTAKSIQSVVEASDQFKNIDTSKVLDEFGNLNLANPGAIALASNLKELGDKLIQVAGSGGDVTAAFNNMGPAFDALAAGTGLSRDKILELARSFGVVPNELNVLVNVAGKDQAIQDITALDLKAKSLGDGVHEITMIMKSQDAINALTAIGVKVEQINSTTGEVKVTADPSQITNLDVLLSQLRNNAQQPIPAPKVDTPQTPAPQPPPTGTTPPIPAPKVDTPQTPAPTPPPPSTTVVPAPQVATPQTPAPTPPPPTTIPAPQVDTPVVPPIQMPPPPPPIHIEVEGVDGAVGSINNIAGAVDELSGKVSGAGGPWNDYAAAISGAMASAEGAVSGAVGSIQGALDGAAGGAASSGASLGQGFADGISSKVGAVQAAALALAQAAAAPLPRSPALIGPFSGTGWTPFRGKKLSEGFAQGIQDGADSAQIAALAVASQVSDALDSVRAVFGAPKANLSANVGPGEGGNLFVRDTSKTDADLAKARADKDAAQIAKAAEDARFSASDAAKDTAKAVEKGNKNNKVSDSEQKKINTDLASSLSISQQKVIDQIVSEGAQNGLSQDQINSAVAAAIAESGLRNAPRTVGDPQAATAQQIAAQINSAMALTTESINRQGGDLQRIADGNAKSVDYDQEIVRNTDIMNKSIVTGNDNLDASIALLQSGTGSDEEVIRALQQIDDTIATTPDRTTHDDLQNLEKAVMEDRGINKFDPNQGASKDVPGDTLKVLQGVVGLVDTISQGLSAAGNAAAGLARGFSGTEDVNKFVDNVQSVASTIGSVVSTVSEIISTVASIAAVAGAAIPGVGEVAAAASAVSGGIGAANGVVDLIQQVVKIGSGFVGMALSGIAGGDKGGLMGNVKVLLDTNNGTVSTWSEDNPQDKRVHSFADPSASGTVNNQTTTGVGTLQVFAGPGDDPNKVMADAMFAIRAANVGAGAYG